ncbi:MAG: VTT domain-containing protein [Kineosporiaceae bacterium]
MTHTAMLAAGHLALLPEWLSADGLLDALGTWAFWGAVAVVFAECGLLIGFFLPGDSLLFTVGLLISSGTIDQNIAVACVILTAAAFVGNVVGYEVGRKVGPALFSKPESKLFKREYVEKTEAFFARYGNRAIFLARFTPIVRTFITVTAGIGRMDRRRYLAWSGIGAIVWAAGVTLLGYFLGRIAFVREHVELILLLLVAVSVLPVVIEVWRERRRGAAESASPEGVELAVQAPEGAVPAARADGSGRHRA